MFTHKEIKCGYIYTISIVADSAVICVFCSIFVEEATKSVTLKLAEFSEPRFYHQFGKNEQKILFVMCKWLDLPVSSIGN